MCHLYNLYRNWHQGIIRQARLFVNGSLVQITQPLLCVYCMCTPLVDLLQTQVNARSHSVRLLHFAKHVFQGIHSTTAFTTAVIGHREGKTKLLITQLSRQLFRIYLGWMGKLPSDQYLWRCIKRGSTSVKLTSDVQSFSRYPDRKICLIHIDLKRNKQLKNIINPRMTS